MLRFLFPRAVACGLLAAAAVLPVRATHAGILTEFAFTGYLGTGGTAGNTNGVSAATTTDPNATASAYTANLAGFEAVGAGGTAGNYAFDTAGDTSGGTGTDRAFGTQSSGTPATEALAVTDATYYSFTLTPASGASLSLTSFTFDLRTRINSGTASPYSTSFVLRTSLDGFAADDGGTVGGTQTGAGNTGYVTQTFSLAALGTLPVNTAITFRLYTYDNQNTGNDDFAQDDVIVNGVVNVPEPATWALLVVGLAALAVIRRRRAS